MSITRSSGRRRIGAASIFVGVTLLAFGAFAPSAKAVPSPGNNGTIKIDGVDFDQHPNNEPHVGCVFEVDFYGYEANVPVSMVFKVHPPTGNEVIETVEGELDDDDATGGGSEAGHDGHFVIDLTDVLTTFTPHPIQGYHVKLTITADDGDSHGNQDKHKTFWVTGCEAPSDDGGPTDGDDSVSATSGTVDTPSESSDTEVEGEVITPAPASLPVTGAEDRSLLVLGIGFIAIGSVVLVAKRAVFLG